MVVIMIMMILVYSYNYDDDDDDDLVADYCGLAMMIVIKPSFVCQN